MCLSPKNGFRVAKNSNSHLVMCVHHVPKNMCFVAKAQGLGEDDLPYDGEATNGSPGMMLHFS